MTPTYLSRLDFDDLMERLQADCELVHQLQIEREDLLDERPTYCVWTIKCCKTPNGPKFESSGVSLQAYEADFRLHLDVLEPEEDDSWSVASYWEGDAFPYGNCPLYFLALAERVIDLEWRLEVLQNHRDLADCLQASYLPTTVQ